jgi:hypothetical protein
MRRRLSDFIISKSLVRAACESVAKACLPPSFNQWRRSRASLVLARERCLDQLASALR